jgi:protein SCO1
MRHRLTFAWALSGLFGACAAVFAGAPETPSASIYQLDAKLTDQAGKVQGLDVYRGHPVLITMFYASCPAACPLIIDTLRATEKDLSDTQRSELRVLMISIDPDRDTPAELKKLAEQRRIDTSRWTLARTDEATVRTIAALLNVQYRELPNGEFNHASIITLLSPEGEIVASSPKLGTPDPALLAKLRD